MLTVIALVINILIALVLLVVLCIDKRDTIKIVTIETMMIGGDEDVYE